MKDTESKISEIKLPSYEVEKNLENNKAWPEIAPTGYSALCVQTSEQSGCDSQSSPSFLNHLGWWFNNEHHIYFHPINEIS